MKVLKPVEYYRSGTPSPEMIRKEELLVDLCDALKTLIGEYESTAMADATHSGVKYVEELALKRAKTVLRRAELNR